MPIVANNDTSQALDVILLKHHLNFISIRVQTIPDKLS